MWFTIGFGAVCALCAYPAAWYWWVAAGVVFAGWLLGNLFLKRRGVFSALLAICIGFSAGFFWFHGYDAVYLNEIRELDGKMMDIRVRSSGYSMAGAYGSTVDGTVKINGKQYQVRLYLKNSSEAEAVSPGYDIEGKFRLRMTTESGDTAYFPGRGIFLLAYQTDSPVAFSPKAAAFRDFPALLHHRVISILEKSFSADTVPVAKALFLGDTGALDYGMDTAFKISGIRHIVAVSGLHISILFSVVYLLCGKRRFLTAIIGIPCLLLFSATAGFTPSVTRACLMQIIMLLAVVFEREYDPPTALSFAALVMLLANPMIILSVSFQLSLACMVGIFLFSGRIYAWMLSPKCFGEAKGKTFVPRAKRWLSGSVSVTLGATVMTTPLSALYFGTISLVGILTNLMTLWMVTLVFYGIILVCIGGAIWLPAGIWIAGIVQWGIRYIQAVARLLTRVPFAAVYTKSIYIVFWLVCAYLLIAVFQIMKKKRPAALAAYLILGLCAALLVSWLEPIFCECRVTMLDVGQGQCILLQSGGKSFLVDCGGTDAKDASDSAAETLLSQGISRLDGLILTHYDSDHSNGVVNLLSRIDADGVFIPSAEDPEGIGALVADHTGGTVLRIRETLALTYEDTVVTIIPPVLTDSSNDSSLCVLFQTNNCAILITGDRSAFGERALLRQAALPDLDVLVVGHHGSAGSVCEELLRETTPEIAMISVGLDNRYGHPAQEVLDRLENFGCRIYRTDQCGTILFRR